MTTAKTLPGRIPKRPRVAVAQKYEIGVKKSGVHVWDACKGAKRAVPSRNVVERAPRKG